jgi:hypothetical protein
MNTKKNWMKEEKYKNLHGFIGMNFKKG